MSYQAYQKIQQSTETPSQVEFRLFAKVTGALRDVENLDCRDAKLIKALDWNRRMWSTFASDCGAEGNELPKQTRASIISLSLFVSRYSSTVVRGKGTIGALIKINKTIMEGLAQQSRLQAKAATEANSQKPPSSIDQSG